MTDDASKPDPDGLYHDQQHRDPGQGRAANSITAEQAIAYLAQWSPPAYASDTARAAVSLAEQVFRLRAERDAAVDRAAAAERERDETQAAQGIAAAAAVVVRGEAERQYARAESLAAENARLREALTFNAFRAANVARCVKWHPAGIDSWSPSDWLTALTGEIGELASLLKMRNRERDGLPGNKFSPTDQQIADEIADVLTYLDLLAAMLGVDLGRAAAEKFNAVSKRVGFPDRLPLPDSDSNLNCAAGAGEADEVREAEPAELVERFFAAYDAWANSDELCGGPLFDAMLAARDGAAAVYPWPGDEGIAEPGAVDEGRREATRTLPDDGPPPPA